MKDYVIMTDSCCDLSREYIEKNNISFVSLTCRFAGKEYPDDFGRSLGYKEFYDEMRKGEMPNTSQPNPEAFYKAFETILQHNKDILCVCVSSGLSGTFNSANIARDMVKDKFPDARIVLIDTLTASLGQGLMVIKAVGMKQKGASIEQIADHLESIKMNLNTYITVDDLSHLKRGGRISSAAALLGSVLHVKPILTINNEGKAMPVLKVKGRKSSINKLAEFVVKKIENADEETISICHGDALPEAEKLRDIILKEVKVKDVVINYVGPVVGTHGGPGALAVFFIGKHRQNHLIDIDI